MSGHDKSLRNEWPSRILALLSMWEEGSALLDVTDPTNPCLVAEMNPIDASGASLGVEIAGGEAFVAEGRTGVRAFPLPDSPVCSEGGSEPLLESPIRLETPGASYAWDLEVANDTAYIAFLEVQPERGGLQVTLIPEPSRFVLLVSALGALAALRWKRRRS